MEPESEAIAVDTLGSVDTLISESDFVLARPVDLAIGKDGEVYVLDTGMPAVVRVMPSGKVEPIVEGEGAGPGELSRPIAIAVDADTLRVVDRGNGRIQVLTLEGDYIRSRPSVPGVELGATIRDDGWIAVPTEGLRDSVLVRVFDGGGESVRSVGKLVVSVPDVMDFGRIKREIADGGVPDQFRNLAIPVFAEDDGLWIVLSTEGEVRRYGKEGETLWEREIDLLEMPRIREAFFERNRELANNPATFSRLRYFVDAQAVGDRLWLLLNMPDSEPTVVVILSGDGSVERKYIVPGMEGARALAVDGSRDRLYLSGGASLIAVEAPLKPGAP